MPTHEVQEGECISSIAAQFGFFPETLWNHPDNAALKELREDPNVLMAGDKVFVPELRIKQESGATEQRHRFRKKGVPAKFRLQIMLDDQPRKNVSYRLEVDGVWREGKTDGDGFIEESIPPSTRAAHLVIEDTDGTSHFDLQFGTLDPLDTESGVRDRLHDLGYEVSDSDTLSDLLKAFQTKEELEPTGTLDDATKDKLKERFGQ